MCDIDKILEDFENGKDVRISKSMQRTLVSFYTEMRKQIRQELKDFDKLYNEHKENLSYDDIVDIEDQKYMLNKQYLICISMLDKLKGEC